MIKILVWFLRRRRIEVSVSMACSSAGMAFFPKATMTSSGTGRSFLAQSVSQELTVLPWYLGEKGSNQKRPRSNRLMANKKAAALVFGYLTTVFENDRTVHPNSNELSSMARGDKL